MKESFACHAENSKIQLCKDEKEIQNIVSCFLEFQCDPFDESNIKLTSLQSGQIAMDELVQDFKTAHADGEILVNTFSDNIPCLMLPFIDTNEAASVNHQLSQLLCNPCR